MEEKSLKIKAVLGISIYVLEKNNAVIAIKYNGDLIRSYPNYTLTRIPLFFLMQMPYQQQQQNPQTKQTRLKYKKKYLKSKLEFSYSINSYHAKQYSNTLQSMETVIEKLIQKIQTIGEDPTTVLVFQTQ